MIYPLLAQVGLTLCVIGLLGILRVTHIRKAGFKAVLRNGFPAKAEQTSANLKHQFEAPVLFYVLGLLFVTTLETTSVALVLAWAYVALRVIHAGIQLTHDTIFPWRFGTFVVSMGVLIALFAVALLQGFAA
jgi:hypothetical protein